MKKILFILGTIVLIILIGAGLFFFFGGNKRDISNFFNENNDFGSFFNTNTQSQNDAPFGTSTDTTVTETLVNGKYVAPTLRQISFEPVSGFTFYATTSTSTRASADPQPGDILEEFLATSTVIRFQERATGHLYDVFEFLPAPEKISNITVQKIYNTIFTNNKNEFLQELATFNNEQIKTIFVKNIPMQSSGTSTPTEQKLEQKEISNIISDFTYIKEKNKLIYSIKNATGANIYISDSQRSTETLLTSVPFSEFTLESIGGDYVLLQTKASALAVGYAYILNISTGSLDKFLGNISGLLTKASPNLQYFLYSESDRSRPIIRSYDIKNRVTRRIGLDTIPEKCVFSKKDSAQIYCFGSIQYKAGTYPDDWYKGKIFNSEDLYKIDLSTGIVEVIYVFDKEKRGNFDITKPMITDADTFIIFQNKYDLTLWSINLGALSNSF